MAALLLVLMLELTQVVQQILAEQKLKAELVQVSVDKLVLKVQLMLHILMKLLALVLTDKRLYL